MEWILDSTRKLGFDEIKKHTDITEYYLINNLTSNYKIDGEYNKSVELIKEVLENKDYNFTKHEVFKLKIKQSTNLRLDAKVDEAIEILEAIKNELINSDDRHTYAHCIQELGISYIKKNKMDEALEIFLEAEEIYKSDINKNEERINRHLAYLYIEMADIYWIRQELEENKNYLDKALEYLKGINDPFCNWNYI